jgi:hypothetical protein
VRDVRDRDRHRRCGGHFDGFAGAASHAASGIRRQTVDGRRLCRWLSRHPDPAEHSTDCVCRDGRRICRETVCRGVLARFPVGRALRRVRDRARRHQSQARPEVAAGADRDSIQRWPHLFCRWLF